MIQQKSSLSNLLKATIPYNPLNISPTVQTHLLDRACPLSMWATVHQLSAKKQSKKGRGKKNYRLLKSECNVR